MAAASVAATAAKRGDITDRVQTGVRIEKRILQVLKALAEYHDMTLGDLIEGIVLHAFDGKVAFGDDTLRRIAELKKVYGLELDSGDSPRLIENDDGEGDSETEPIKEASVT